MKTNTYIIYSSYIFVIYSLYTAFHKHFWKNGQIKEDTKTKGGRTRCSKTNTKMLRVSTFGWDGRDGRELAALFILQCGWIHANLR